MKIVLTKEEFKKLHDYIEYKAMNSDPCRDCTENGQCCGCSEKTAYEDGLREIGLSNDILENQTFRAYIQKRLAYYEATLAAESYNARAKRYFAEAQKYRDMFLVEGQIEEENNENHNS